MEVTTSCTIVLINGNILSKTDKLLNIKNLPLSFILTHAAHVCLFPLLDLPWPCPIGTWQEAAMWIVVVKYTSMSQSVDQMELPILTLVWPAVLIVVILALGWVYFINSSSVVYPTCCDKDRIGFRCSPNDFGLPFQEAADSSLWQIPSRKKAMQCCQSFQGWNLVLHPPSSTLHFMPTQWNLIRLSLPLVPRQGLVNDLKVKMTTVGADRGLGEHSPDRSLKDGQCPFFIDYHFSSDFF
jgi:hypothetical protein